MYLITIFVFLISLKCKIPKKNPRRLLGFRRWTDKFIHSTLHEQCVSN